MFKKTERSLQHSFRGQNGRLRANVAALRDEIGSISKPCIDPTPLVCEQYIGHVRRFDHAAQHVHGPVAAGNQDASRWDSKCGQRAIVSRPLAIIPPSQATRPCGQEMMTSSLSRRVACSSWWCFQTAWFAVNVLRGKSHQIKP